MPIASELDDDNMLDADAACEPTSLEWMVAQERVSPRPDRGRRMFRREHVQRRAQRFGDSGALTSGAVSV
jgi:hypothetical protein